MLDVRDELQKIQWEAIKQAFIRVSNLAKQVIPKVGTQMNESLHNSYTITRTKRKDFKKKCCW